MDFPARRKTGRGVLLLHGWVDWPDGSTFRAASQEEQSGSCYALPSDAVRGG